MCPLHIYVIIRRETKFIEGMILIILSSGIIPANLLAIYQFYKKRLNKMFFLLTTCLCFCNFGMSVVGFVDGLAKFSDDHPLGIVDCGISLILGCSTSTITMFIQALISFERRKVATSIEILTFHNRVYVLLILSFLGGFASWTIIFGVLGGMELTELRTDPKSMTTVAYYPGLIEVVFALFTFTIPAMCIVTNYWYITLSSFIKSNLQSL